MSETIIGSIKLLILIGLSFLIVKFIRDGRVHAFGLLPPISVAVSKGLKLGLSYMFLLIHLAIYVPILFDLPPYISRLLTVDLLSDTTISKTHGLLLFTFISSVFFLNLYCNSSPPRSSRYFLLSLYWLAGIWSLLFIIVSRIASGFHPQF